MKQLSVLSLINVNIINVRANHIARVAHIDVVKFNTNNIVVNDMSPNLLS